MARRRKLTKAQRLSRRRAQSKKQWAGGMVQVDVGDINETVAQLHDVPREMEHFVPLVVHKAALDTVAQAKAFCVVDTGFLSSSIGFTMDRDGLGATVGPSAAYGAFVELGTSRMAPRAYLGPAFDRVTPGFVSALEQIADRMLG